MKNPDILVGSGTLAKLAPWLKAQQDISTVVVITDNQVKNLFGKRLIKDLESCGKRLEILSFPAGEKYKNETVKMKLDHQMLAKKCGRDSLILAFGGGVVGDMAGFVAATYMRGIPYVQVPTSLLAMVDSCIGGKVGVDTPYGKNLIGAFWHPRMVFIDLDFLEFLPENQLVSGLMEVFKIFLTCDSKAFEYLMANREKILSKDKVALTWIIKRALELKIYIIENDEREENLRMILNFGHTIGHALEYVSEYRLLHGFAVALGILVESRAAVALGVLPAPAYELILRGLKEFGIDDRELNNFNISKILSAIKLDKKAIGGKSKYVLLSGIGSVNMKNGKVAEEVSDELIKTCFS